MPLPDAVTRAPPKLNIPDATMTTSSLAALSLSDLDNSGPESEQASPNSTTSYNPLHQRPVMERQTSADSTASSTFSATADPSPAALLQAHRAEAFQQQQIRQRPRNRSPFSRTHLRSYSAASTLSAPAMMRTRSLPSVGPTGTRSPSLSPSRSPARQASPARSRPSSRGSINDPQTRPASSSALSGGGSFMDIEVIAEDSELEVTPRGPTYLSDGPHTPAAYSAMPVHGNTFPRSNSTNRRRPASPLHHLTTGQAYSPATSPTLSHATLSRNSVPPTSTPIVVVVPSKYNEAFPVSAASSIPSTPTSLRSRSPSISSLETIPDSPDAEDAAVEAFESARMKMISEAAEEEEEDGEIRPGRSFSVGFGPSKNPSEKRKRWSVCGAERRGDFEMETIWED